MRRRVLIRMICQTPITKDQSGWFWTRDWVSIDAHGWMSDFNEYPGGKDHLLEVDPLLDVPTQEYLK